MSEIGEWIESHTQALASIAAETEIEGRLVHPFAVPVLAGLDDETIHGPLLGLMDLLISRRSPLDGAATPLERIRHLAFRQ